MKKFSLNYIGNAILAYITPTITKYNQEMDDTITDIITNGELVKVSQLHDLALFNHNNEYKIIWLANKFYCYGHVWNFELGNTYVRPSRKTMLKLWEMVEDFVNENGYCAIGDIYSQLFPSTKKKYSFTEVMDQGV